jgi:hypothetical protein
MSERLERTGQIWYFWYFNKDKIDSLFSQLNGRLETERTEEKSKSLDGKVSASAEVGGILASLGIGKLAAAGEAQKTASQVLSVTATLSPANKTLVLIEYLQRVSQLAVVRINDAEETSVVNEVTGRPFQLLLGTFDRKDNVDAKRAVLRSERRSGAGGPMVEVPLLYQNELNDQFWVDEEEYVAMGVFAQVFVRPGKFVASPIAIWYATLSPLDAVWVYWAPRSESLPQPAQLELVPPEADTTG